VISDILKLFALFMIGIFILVPIYVSCHKEMIWEYIKEKMKEEQEHKKYRR
jgi:flagellar biosynthesis protein FliP